MYHVLTWIYSWPFWLGGLVGLTGLYLYRFIECEYGNRHHPLPGGARYHVVGPGRVWIAGLMAALTVGYVLLSATRAEQNTVGLTNRLSACQTNINTTLGLRSELSAQDSEISNRVSDLRSQLDEAMATLMSRILNPPPDIAKLDQDDPRRVAWRQDAEYAYSDWATKLRAQINVLTDKRRALASDRAQHPIPPLQC